MKTAKPKARAAARNSKARAPARRSKVRAPARGGRVIRSGYVDTRDGQLHYREVAGLDDGARQRERKTSILQQIFRANCELQERLGPKA